MSDKHDQREDRARGDTPAIWQFLQSIGYYCNGKEATTVARLPSDYADKPDVAPGLFILNNLSPLLLSQAQTV